MLNATKEERQRWKSYHPFDKDKVNSPWDSAPDLEELNEDAYEIICDEIDCLQEDPQRNSRGILVLGEAGMGKSHLLSRFAHKLTGPQYTNKTTLSQP